MKSGSVDNALSHLTLSTDEAAFIFNEDWLHVITKKNFRMNRKSMLSLWQKIGTVCNDNKTRRVLLEFKGKQPSMETTDTYESAVRASQSVRNFRLAILADESGSQEMESFFKTVMANRGTKCEFFTDRKSALEWLLSKKG